MKLPAGLTAAAVLLVVAGPVLAACGSSSDTGPVTEAPETAASQAAPAAPSGDAAASGTSTKTYSMADVAAHGTPADCWAAIGGDVYDLTAWIDQHPGGSGYIAELCGTDGTPQFASMHGGSQYPIDVLASFKIGTLTD